ncbi:MAG: TOBE domain-containing protein, partial [Pseudomonadales bacterium]|nr:TOBE domain-containing protein [Pseudomonadales bacterium]
YALYPHKTVRENMGFGLQVAHAPKSEIEARVNQAARTLKLEDYLDRKPKALSGGQRQRVAIGRAIVREPSAFLFDEPLSNLDAKLRVEMRTEMKLMHQRLKTTTVYVTHDQIEAMTLGDKVAVMKDGIIQQFGTPKQIYNDPANLFVASFIGSPPMNFIPLRLQRKDGRLLALLDSGQARCELPMSMDDAGLEDREVILGLRPEQIVLASADAAGMPTIRAEVQVTEPTGPDTLVFVQLNEAKVCCRLAPDVAPQVGETLTLQFDPAKVLLFDAKTGERLGTAASLPVQDRADNVTRIKGR